MWAAATPGGRLEHLTGGFGCGRPNRPSEAGPLICLLGRGCCGQIRSLWNQDRRRQWDEIRKSAMVASAPLLRAVARRCFSESAIEAQISGHVPLLASNVLFFCFVLKERFDSNRAASKPPAADSIDFGRSTLQRTYFRWACRSFDDEEIRLRALSFSFCLLWSSSSSVFSIRIRTSLCLPSVPSEPPPHKHIAELLSS